ncbi:hypothetical protein LMG26854_05337 [Achromobacter aegrifaciens]|uniref:hypothetical protein n=1 Tax=Achromobacter TaxID=222 RepID=UPI001468DFDA|nr:MULTISPECIES: hypothetical protein [Achromobacter]MBD9476199.1 hypothetical protein [Achromobacter sp. ACM01]CAB3897783.1 hypothetical protein LMG26854_05337 [Achromobacter aegrifaciens]
MQKEIHDVLIQNLGNRLTPELINGLAATILRIVRNAGADAMKPQETGVQEGPKDA